MTTEELYSKLTQADYAVLTIVSLEKLLVGVKDKSELMDAFHEKLFSLVNEKGLNIKGSLALYMLYRVRELAVAAGIPLGRGFYCKPREGVQWSGRVVTVRYNGRIACYVCFGDNGQVELLTRNLAQCHKHRGVYSVPFDQLTLTIRQEQIAQMDSLEYTLTDTAPEPKSKPSKDAPDEQLLRSMFELVLDTGDTVYTEAFIKMLNDRRGRA